MGRRTYRRCSNSTPRLQSLRPPLVSGAGALAVLIGLQQQRRDLNALSIAIDRDERQIRAAGQPAHAGQRLLRKHFDLHFERRGPDGGDARLENDQVADLDRVEELQAVDRGRHEQRAGVAVAGDRAGDVDEVHDRPAEDEPERVGVVRQDDLHHLGGRLRGALGGQR